MKPRDDKKIKKIFKATLQLVEEKGVAGITMGEIARAARIATGTLYIYFTSKDDLVNVLFTDCRKAALDAYFERYDPATDFKAGFRVIWLNILKFRTEHFEEAIFMDQCYHSPFITERTKDIANKMIQPLFKLVERGKAEKLLKDIDSFTLLVFMIGSITEYVKHSIYRGKKMSRPLVEQMFNICWDGVKK